MPLPSIYEVNRAHDLARARGALVEEFELDGVTYRHTVLQGEPELAWKVFVSAMGDVVVEKEPGGQLHRPARTVNENYLLVSIKRLNSQGPDAYLRRRIHWLVAVAFKGPPPSPGAVASHLNDDGLDCRAENIIWASQSENRATRSANAGHVPKHKMRKVYVPLHLARVLGVRKHLRGRKLDRYLEQLVRRDLRSGR